MKAIGFLRDPLINGGSFEEFEIEKTLPTGRDLLVEVKAVSVNPLDVKMRSRGDLVKKIPMVLGWDAAGVVVEVGPDCSLFKPGDAVYYAGSIMQSGCCSEFHLVDERIVGRKPKTLDFAQAASLPLTGLTAWEGLFERLSISLQNDAHQEQSILIIGSAGGVGSIATQLAKLAGLYVIGTASREESIKWTTAHGASFAIDHNHLFAPQLKEIGFSSVDYIFCLNGLGKYWGQMARVIVPQGKICSVVDPDCPVDLSLLKNKSATFAWQAVFTRSSYQTADMIEQHKILNALSELVDHGKIKQTVAECLTPINAANMELAHKKLESGRMIGKIVLKQFRN
ncbi:zinc-binding alcohol dehydrogenase family protein [Aneurinibacillus sp. Ricciae_BoGa-3]|uniref:zinc-binding alcohol dehydrogenase family protein n=1 Tax=Aneurinibacillus sp. Ricciae_BoGa-3 TaxID=3022697 RepID=UPI00234170F7|nr:zinc-binding alcohol dehydrogenase family protein [Aneurinibacillus sp. Ricciae_BoGa-3]WCK56358.1 zinc-binding alcohol dehydrogenase family protein [Aneurinibacillus sp. Ricciae_BoGa-3]